MYMYMQCIHVHVGVCGHLHEDGTCVYVHNLSIFNYSNTIIISDSQIFLSSLGHAARIFLFILDNGKTIYDTITVDQ